MREGGEQGLGKTYSVNVFLKLEIKLFYECDAKAAGNAASGNEVRV